MYAQSAPVVKPHSTSAQDHLTLVHLNGLIVGAQGDLGRGLR